MKVLLLFFVLAGCSHQKVVTNSAGRRIASIESPYVVFALMNKTSKSVISLDHWEAKEVMDLEFTVNPMETTQNLLDQAWDKLDREEHELAVRLKEKSHELLKQFSSKKNLSNYIGDEGYSSEIIPNDVVPQVVASFENGVGATNYQGWAELAPIDQASVIMNLLLHEEYKTNPNLIRHSAQKLLSQEVFRMSEWRERLIK